MKKLAIILLMSIMGGCSAATGATQLSNTELTTSAQQSTIAQTIPVEQTTAVAKILTGEEVVTALKAAGIKVEKVVTYNEETDSNNLLGRPNQYTSKSNFALKGDEVTKGEDPDNTIEVFETEEDAKARKQYIEQAIKGISFAQQYIYQKGVYVLRIDNQTTPMNAKKIEEVFYNIVK